MNSVAREGMVHRDRGRKSNGQSNGVNLETYHRSPLMSWTDPASSTLPSVPARRLRVPLSDIRYADQLYGRRIGRKKGRLLLCLFIFSMGCIFFALAKLLRSTRRRTLVFGRENLQCIWKWEIESGHYPSNRGSMQIQRVLASTD